MIDKILNKVDEQFGTELAQFSELDRSTIPAALQIISSTVLGKAKEMLQGGNLMQVKEIFDGNNGDQKAALLSELKDDVTNNLTTELGISPQAASDLVLKAFPQIINAAKEQVLGPNGKLDITDVPRLLSLINSGGK